MNTKASDSKKSTPAAFPQFSEGQKLAGCYGLRRRLAQTDGIEIWLAHDEVLGKDVSLHFVPVALLGDAAAMNDLRQEVKRTRQLIHPHILRVYDLVEDAEWAAVSMDAFDGESLRANFAKAGGAGLDPATIQPWVAPLCQTIEDAHKINVAHRGLSPENVFIGRDGKVCVTSFGISRCIAEAVARITGQSGPGSGSASPQQIEAVAPTRLDDVYAIGALLFESLTGRLPFVGDDLPMQIRSAAPPSIASLRGKMATPVPAAWEKTVAACLEKKPENRPQSAAEIAARIAAAEADTALSAGVAPKVPVVSEKTAPAVKKLPPAAKTRPVLPAEIVQGTPVSLVKPDVVQPPAERQFVPDLYVNVESERSRFPTMGLAVAAGLMVVGAVGYYFNGGKGTQPAVSTTEWTPSEQPEGSELRSVANKIETPAPTLPALPTSEETPPVAPQVAVPVIAPAIPDSEMLLAAVATPAPAAPVPAAVPVVALDEDKVVAEKAAALEKSKQAAQAAEKARAEMAKQQQQAEAAVAEAQKILDQKSKTLAPVKKAAEDVMSQRKKLEDEQKAADLAAEQARQLATEKARVADSAKKAIADLELKNKDKLAAQEKADAEMQSLQKLLAEKQQSATSMAKASTDAEASRQQYLAAIKQNEQEVEMAKVAAAEARRLREEAEAERRKLGQELAEMQKMMEKKKAEIEERLKKLETPAAKPSVTAPAPEPAHIPEVKPPEKTPVPMPPVKPIVSATPPPAPATPSPVAVAPKPVVPVAPVPTPIAPPPVVVESKPVPLPPVAPVPVPADPPQLAMKTDPAKVPSFPPTVAPKTTPAGSGAENSLGLKFVPVADVDFSVWQTRVKDFDAFARAVNLKSSAWRGPGFKQGPDHPVVNVTWVEAVAFCKWLTDLEHKDGVLPANQYYRLPTDLEWSKAVGLADEPGKTPEARDMGVSDVYPWGTQWPPPPNSGNYTGEETGSDVAIKGYDDGFAWTSPVGSFPPNKSGIYDMGGNVWQWCMDAWNNESKAKVLRGASWYNGALKLSLLSSCRVHASPDSSTDNYGFRIVRAADGGRSGKK